MNDDLLKVQTISSAQNHDESECQSGFSICVDDKEEAHLHHLHGRLSQNLIL